MTILWGILAAYVGLCVYLIYLRGPFCLCYSPLMAVLLRKLNVVAMTIGARGYLVKPAAEFTPEQIVELEKHEGWHSDHQWRVFGPLFPPLYLLALAIQGYDHNWFEVKAREAAGEPKR